MMSTGLTRQKWLHPYTHPTVKESVSRFAWPSLCLPACLPARGPIYTPVFRAVLWFCWTGRDSLSPTRIACPAANVCARKNCFPLSEERELILERTITIGHDIGKNTAGTSALHVLRCIQYVRSGDRT